jgi:hypothetical protein
MAVRRTFSCVRSGLKTMVAHDARSDLSDLGAGVYGDLACDVMVLARVLGILAPVLPVCTLRRAMMLDPY